MRRVWLRGRDNVQKRYLIHVAGYNLGLLMRLLTGAGMPATIDATVLIESHCPPWSRRLMLDEASP